MPFYPGNAAALIVSEGATLINPTTTLNFESGTLVNAGGGVANYTPPASSGGGGFTGTYHAVAGRTIGTVYTNSGTSVIFYSIIVYSAAQYSKLFLLINGNQVAIADMETSAGFSTLYAFTNPGDTIELQINYGTFTIYTWNERY